jgi:asparagine synthase (glutamine-hydrolysing)
MCGICGFINLDGRPAERAILERMNRALLHRGPDEGGVFIAGPAALAMRRLSIIDLAGGSQPMANEDGRVRIVFNGEIYNSPRLKEQLETQGHRFANHSDTETIVHQYEEAGPACVEALRGMFAFAILDQRGEADRPSLLLARDRIGIKPLFYYHDHQLLAFSSELTSLVQHPQIPRQIEPGALHQYLAAGAVAAPLTMFKGIRQLLPGHYLFLQQNEPVIKTYWQVPPAPIPNPPNLPEAAAQLRGLLEEAVQEHLLSDVPVGAFLSGGIDSSSVVALMAQVSGQKIPTFSIRFEEAGYDESPFARLVAERYGTEHHEFTVPNQGFDPDLLHAIITHHGQPTVDSSALPTFLVSRLARDYVKVVLSGDGGDESFAGYYHFGWGRQIDRLYRYPYGIRQLAAGALRQLAGWPGFEQQDRLRQAIYATEISLGERALIPLQLLRYHSDTELDQLLSPEWRFNGSALDGELRQLLRENRQPDVMDQALRFAFRYYLPDAYLAKVDRMSMANALEVRVPLLDHRLVEFSLALPARLHWQNGVGKQLLRRAVADLLPEAIFSHRKQGFSIPLERWVTQNYFELAESLLNEAAVRRRGLFNPAAVRRLLELSQGQRQHRRSLVSEHRLSHQVFMLVVLELWCRLYLDDLIEWPSEAARWETQVQEQVYG